MHNDPSRISVGLQSGVEARNRGTGSVLLPCECCRETLLYWVVTYRVGERNKARLPQLLVVMHHGVWDELFGSCFEEVIRHVFHLTHQVGS